MPSSVNDGGDVFHGLVLQARESQRASVPTPGTPTFHSRALTVRSLRVRCPLLIRSHVPDALEPVTSVGREDRPCDLGVEPANAARIWEAVERLYRTGIHPAIQLCVRRHGGVLIDRAIGHSAGNGPDDPPEAAKIPLTTATPFTIFSAAKAVTAMLVHLLDERDLIRLDDPVSEYIPDFGVHTKQWITIRHVLIHRAGIPNLTGAAIDLDRLDDPEAIVRLLCEGPQTWRPGRQLAYHAFTGGFILGELVRRVTGMSIRTMLDREIRRPMALRWMSYGVRPDQVDEVAVNYFTGPPLLPPVSTVLRRALGVGFREATEMSNDPRFLTGVIPSANVVATAGELAAFYQLLLDGGEYGGTRIFDPRTIRRATSEQSYFEVDLTLGLPFRYGMGFMLGGQWLSPYGPDTQYAFGHLGFTNIVAWADPERRVAATLLTSGKPFVYPGLYHAFDVLRQIGLACGKERIQPGVVHPPAELPRRARPAEN
jgi:CubicO group peptidase (beta-lactamase class C family)